MKEKNTPSQARQYLQSLLACSIWKMLLTWLLYFLFLSLILINLVERRYGFVLVPLGLTALLYRYSPVRRQHARMKCCLDRLEEKKLLIPAANQLAGEPPLFREGRCILTRDFLLEGSGGLLWHIQDIRGLQYEYSDDEDGISQTLRGTLDGTQWRILLYVNWANSEPFEKLIRLLRERNPSITVTRKREVS